MSDDEFEQASREQWASAAESWAAEAAERERGPAGEAAQRMLALAALEPGERVVEIACGAGDVGLRAAGAVGEGGRVVCTDFAAEMVEIVRERARGLPQVEARVHDGHEPLDERFDALLCRFGYMLMADPARSLAAGRASLREGGRLVVGVWGRGEENPWLSLVFDATMRVLSAPPPAPGTPGPFALADNERLAELLTGAGLRDVAVEELRSEREYESVARWWERVGTEPGPIEALLRHIAPEQRAAIEAGATAAAGRFVAGDGRAVFPAAAVVARAVA